MTFEIDPAKHEGRVPNRMLGLTVRWLTAPETVILTLNGNSHNLTPEYDPETLSLMLPPLEIGPEDHLRLEVHATLNRPDTRQAHCLKLLRTFRLESMAKQAIAEKLPQIIENPALLAAFRTDLTNVHLRALLETITGAGVSRITSTGDEEIILWNNAANPAMRFQLAVHQTHVWDIQKRFALEDDPLPAFRAIHPLTEFGENRWALHVDYCGLYITAFR